MEQIDALKKQRATIKSSFTRMYNECAREDITLQEVLPRVDRAEKLLKDFDTLQTQIEELLPQNNPEAEEQYRIYIEEAYYGIKAKGYQLQHSSVAQQHVPSQPQQPSNDGLATAVQALIENQASMNTFMERFASQVRTSTPNETTSQVQCELRLPRVNLPEFSGAILEWRRFKELFEAFVHNRSNLSNIEKLEYLNTKLKGNALSIIKHLQPTANNYTVAWDLLNNKYNSNEIIKKAYMELIFDQPSIKATTFPEVKRFYDNINEGYNALKAIDVTVEQWSSALLYNCEKKLDAETKTLWYREKKPGESTTFTKFLEFLEKKGV